MQFFIDHQAPKETLEVEIDCPATIAVYDELCSVETKWKELSKSGSKDSSFFSALGDQKHVLKEALKVLIRSHIPEDNIIGEIYAKA